MSVCCWIVLPAFQLVFPIRDFFLNRFLPSINCCFFLSRFHSGREIKHQINSDCSMMCPTSPQASLLESEFYSSSISSTWRPHEFQYLKCRVFHLGLYGCSIFFAYGLNGSSHTLGKCKVAVLTLSPNLMMLSPLPLSILIVAKTGKLGSTLGSHSPFLPHLICQQVLLSSPSNLSP